MVRPMGWAPGCAPRTVGGMTLLRSGDLTPDLRMGQSTEALAELGGLSQFGAHRVTLQPGAQSSERHWHEREDELVLVLAGEVVLVDEEGAHVLRPGDAAAFPSGVPNAHHLVNRSAADCVLLVIGTRVRDDVCHYPDTGRRLVTAGTRWQLLEADGRVRQEGTLAEPFPCSCDG